MLAILFSVVFITSLYQFALYVKGITYIWGAVSFTVVFYGLLFRLVVQKNGLIPRFDHLYNTERGQHLMEKIEQHMRVEKPYLRKGLKLEQLADMVALSKNELSGLLNSSYPHGFAHYVKTFRVEEAKRLLFEKPELSLEGVGYEAGFNSKSAFFESFKSVVGCTPSAYKKQKELESTPE